MPAVMDLWNWCLKFTFWKKKLVGGTTIGAVATTLRLENLSSIPAVLFRSRASSEFTVEMDQFSFGRSQVQTSPTYSVDCLEQ